ncbi:MAG TPA: hypothetical protein VIU15_20255, partial [Streptomyces sp.]
MRGLSVRRIASTALCASLVLGVAAPTALAADGTARERGAAAAQAPLPVDAGALLAQTKSLGDLGALLTPVADLLDSVLKAPDGQLTPDKAAALSDAVKAAVAKITAAAPTTPTAPELPATPELLATPAVPPAPDT